MNKPALEFQNDIAELEAAIIMIDDFHDRYTEWDDDAWCTIRNGVPRLIAAYEDLFRLSVTLTDAWDAANQNKTPEGLYLPDGR